MKKIFILIILLISSNLVSYAEKIPVKIIPDQLISTCYDEIQLGDTIRFKVSEDVYLNNKLYIKKDTPVIGIINYVTNNGWSFDNAQIDLNKFKTRDIDNKIVVIDTPISINGFDIIKYKGKKIAQFFNYIGVVFRGKEVEIIPEVDDIRYTIWYHQT